MGIKRFLGSLFFNIAETVLIYLVGVALQLPTRYILITMLTFMISRGCFGKSLHFKTWYRCLVWSTLIMLTLFVFFHVDIVVSTMFAIFSAFIMTGKSNILEIYLWKNISNPSKYQDVIDFVKYNTLDDNLIEFEEKIKKRNNLEFLIYKYKFREQKTFAEMSELLDLETPRIVEHLDKIAFALRLYCGI